VEGGRTRRGKDGPEIGQKVHSREEVGGTRSATFFLAGGRGARRTLRHKKAGTIKKGIILFGKLGV